MAEIIGFFQVVKITLSFISINTIIVLLGESEVSAYYWSTYCVSPFAIQTKLGISSHYGVLSVPCILSDSALVLMRRLDTKYEYSDILNVVLLIAYMEIWDWKYNYCRSHHGTCIRWYPKHVAHAWRKKVFSEQKYPICDCSGSSKMPWTDQITQISS